MPAEHLAFARYEKKGVVNGAASLAVVKLVAAYHHVSVGRPRGFREHLGVVPGNHYGVVLERDHEIRPVVRRGLVADRVVGRVARYERLGKRDEFRPVVSSFPYHAAGLLEGPLLVHEHGSRLGHRDFYFFPAA